AEHEARKPGQQVITVVAVADLAGRVIESTEDVDGEVVHERGDRPGHSGARDVGDVGGDQPPADAVGDLVDARVGPLRVQCRQRFADGIVDLIWPQFVGSSGNGDDLALAVDAAVE